MTERVPVDVGRWNNHLSFQEKRTASLRAHCRAVHDEPGVTCPLEGKAHLGFIWGVVQGSLGITGALQEHKWPRAFEAAWLILLLIDSHTDSDKGPSHSISYSCQTDADF